MNPRFNLLDKVRVTDGSHQGLEGFIIADREERGGVWLYLIVAHGKDYWVPEDWLEIAS